MLDQYLKDIFNTSKTGDATEASYYNVLQRLLESWAAKNSTKKVLIRQLPKKTEAGYPDFRVWDGKQHIIGCIETKPPTADLDSIQDSNQLKRYRGTFPNLILTNFLEWRLYRDGNLIDNIWIARPSILNELKMVPPVENAEAFDEFLKKFFAFSIPKSYTAKTLATALAVYTRFMRDEIVKEELEEEEKIKTGDIYGFYQAFKQYLIASLTVQDFADLYAQTITYGLFAARMRADGEFNRKLAYDYIPHTIGVLRDVFKYISSTEIPTSMEWIVDDIAEILAAADPKKLMHDFFKEGKGRDPIVHFYETFLTAYDPAEREKRGVYYTPEPVVSYIARSVHHILKNRFGKADGLADGDVTVLDPAAGTLTFLAEAAKIASEEFVSKYGEGGKAGFIKDHILRDFYAFELMMAPYAVGHLKMGFLLEELGYRLKEDERFKLYLTNTLEMEELPETMLPGVASLSEESHFAGKVKKEQSILVVIGNPPYSGHSANVGEWISKEIKVYYKVDGKPLGEKNPKWLQDDYVKFIRFAQWKIDQTGQGILGFITNHSYLDNPTFRGMRQSLMNTFGEIYLLDVHGSSLKKETLPSGVSKDENVFDIQQGVAIGLFIKHNDLATPGRIYHADLWGTRDNKNAWLKTENIATTKWRKLTPKPQFYLFVPRDETLVAAYARLPSVTDIFPVHSVGITTARDNLTVRWDPGEVWTTVLNFAKMEKELARSAYDLGKDAQDWKVELAQKDLIESGFDRAKVVPMLYRPFDVRYTYYTGTSRGFIGRPRPEVMKLMLRDNIALITNRQVNSQFRHTFCAESIVNDCAISSETRERSYVFPLYIYPNDEEPNLLSGLTEPNSREANIKTNLLAGLDKAYAGESTPEDIFHYVYAILYSETYRTKYAEFLRIDFPRIPLTKDYDLFKKLAVFGKHLVDLHLFKSRELDPPVARFQSKGDNKVARVHFDSGKVYINDNQYFENVSLEVWKYYVGGYQVCEKWLKDRKGRTLSAEEIKHYCKVVTAIKGTVEIQKQIDQLYPKVEKNLVKSFD